MKKEVRYPEADVISMERMKIEIESLKQELFIVRGEVERFQNTVYPLIENIVETSIKIAKGKSFRRDNMSY